LNKIKPNEDGIRYLTRNKLDDILRFTMEEDLYELSEKEERDRLIKYIKIFDEKVITIFANKAKDVVANNAWVKTNLGFLKEPFHYEQVQKYKEIMYTELEKSTKKWGNKGLDRNSILEIIHETRKKFAATSNIFDQEFLKKMLKTPLTTKEWLSGWGNYFGKYAPDHLGQYLSDNK
jgi:hypothetical protein